MVKWLQAGDFLRSQTLHWLLWANYLVMQGQEVLQKALFMSTRGVKMNWTQSQAPADGMQSSSLSHEEYRLSDHINLWKQNLHTKQFWKMDVQKYWVCPHCPSVSKVIFSPNCSLAGQASATLRLTTYHFFICRDSKPSVIDVKENAFEMERPANFVANFC